MPDEHLSDAFIKSLYARIVQMEQDMAQNAEATAWNTSSIETIWQSTQDIVDTFQALAAGSSCCRDSAGWRSRWPTSWVWARLCKVGTELTDWVWHIKSLQP